MFYMWPPIPAAGGVPAGGIVPPISPLAGAAGLGAACGAGVIGRPILASGSDFPCFIIPMDLCIAASLFAIRASSSLSRSSSLVMRAASSAHSIRGRAIVID